MHMPKLKITLLCIVAAVAYGIVHDQITARLCVEYFTVAHPPLIHTSSPTLLGLFWGTVATIGVGLLLGVVLALVSQSPGLPPVPIRRVLKMIAGLLATTAIAAVLGRRRRFRAVATVGDFHPGKSRSRCSRRPSSSLHGRVVRSRGELPRRCGWRFAVDLPDLAGAGQATRAHGSAKDESRGCSDIVVVAIAAVIIWLRFAAT